jgi:hypothetical protein
MKGLPTGSALATRRAPGDALTPTGSASRRAALRTHGSRRPLQFAAQARPHGNQTSRQ